ncbi:MAG TPA: FUSC family protein [Candidatus Sulfopaludibacter sp.]|nr:FUSC family protein [Candidatus Sulfopaludibacter sp.]
MAAGNTTGGLIACIGALNVAYSDGADPYRLRARRMCAAAVLCSLAVGFGGLCGRNHALAIALSAIAAFVAGLMVAIGTTAADIGTVTLVSLIVFSAHGMSASAALESGGIALAGGLLQTAFALAFWPLRRYQPERRALAAMYTELARSASGTPQIHEAPPASGKSTEAQTALAGLSGDRSLEAERYLSLLSQAERIRLGLLALSRVRARIGRERDGEAAAQSIDRALQLAADALSAVAGRLENRQALPVDAPSSELAKISESLASDRSGDLGALLRDARAQLDGLAGQLRSAGELAWHTGSPGAEEFARRERTQPRTLRLTGPLALLRANLSLDSAALRHALRLAVCVAIGGVVSSAAGWTRAYWCPMTIAIVLRPDFTGTFSRGILRVAGTLIGLVLATGLFHVLSPSIWVHVALIAILAFLLRCFGPANYGIFVIALTGLVVLLIALTGLPPGEVIAARGLNTVAGGAIALAAYAVWPTWERTRLPEELARMLDAYREYFTAVRDSYVEPDAGSSARLDRVRLAARRARSNMEASVARFRSEPGGTADRVTMLDAIMANSHRLIHAIMSLEAGLARSPVAPARDAFRTFADDVARTLTLLSSALHGSPVAPTDLPDLRADHNALYHQGDVRTERYALVNLETDRITNSLNTLSLEIFQWLHSPAAR